MKLIITCTLAFFIGFVAIGQTPIDSAQVYFHIDGVGYAPVSVDDAASMENSIDSDFIAVFSEDTENANVSEEALDPESAEAAVIADLRNTSASALDEAKPHKVLALKTNMLYYAALMPNVEVEWLFNDNWSWLVDANVAWWGKNTKTYRLAVFDTEVRRWIKPRAPWHGFYVGIFGGGGLYDLENGGLGYQGEGYIAGISAGFVWPVKPNLSLEAGLGGGYMYTKYKEYTPIEGHYAYLRTKELNYFGPLKLKFSIVWRFLDKNKKRAGKGK